MTREDYNKLEAMLNDGISKGIYAPTKDNTKISSCFRIFYREILKINMINMKK